MPITQIKPVSLVFKLAAALLIGCGSLSAALFQSNPVVPKWKRFEQSFESSLKYSNPLQDVTLKIVFISPSGHTNIVDGYWDGSKTWKVRFTPNQVGQWSFHTVCSDPTNRGLHFRPGRFLCTPSIGENPFYLHGPVRVARDRRHFEHADGQPFFWMADCVWDGPTFSERKEWEIYANARGGQKFNVAQWAAITDSPAGNQPAFSGPLSQIVVNPDYFRKLDARLETLTRAGIMSAIAPLSDQPGDRPLPDDQAALLLRYMIARWGADPVAWLLPFDTAARTNNSVRWKRIGQAVFAEVAHAPVVMFAGANANLLEDFRDQYWIDVFSFQPVQEVTDEALRSSFAGPWNLEWQKQPTRPVIPFLPFENSVSPGTDKHLMADEVRHAAYWSLMMAPPAGVAYGAAGVENWDTTKDSPPRPGKPAPLAMWQKSLFMPGAKQMVHIRNWMDACEYWRYQPDTRILATQPGAQMPRLLIAGLATAEKDMLACYIPDGQKINALLSAVPELPASSWFNPRNGQRSHAVGVIGDASCQFSTPGPEDWLLLIQSSDKSK